MSLFDFFFPDQAQGAQQRRVGEHGNLSMIQERLRATRSKLAKSKSGKAIEAVQSDIDSICLVIESLIETLEEKGITDRSQLLEKAKEIEARGQLVGRRKTKSNPGFKPRLNPRFVESE